MLRFHYQHQQLHFLSNNLLGILLLWQDILLLWQGQECIPCHQLLMVYQMGSQV
jgi:hypothetical protein